MELDATDTPVLELDLDAVERNIARMQRYCDEHGLALLAHIKTHKLPEIAAMQLAAGARGIVCQKLGEAEVMRAAGIEDILITFPLLGETKLRRLARLAATARVTVAVDSAEVARGLSGALGGTSVDVLVDCDTGFGRTGVQSVADAVALAEQVAVMPGLRFAGLMTHPTPADGDFLAAARCELERRDVPVARVGGGGTPAAFRTHTHPELTELRVGTYVYGDRRSIAAGVVAEEDCALRVRTTVVSRPTATRAILDAGSKTLTTDDASGAGGGYGLIVEYPDARITAVSEEHGHVALSGPGPSVGEVVTVIPNHACAVTNLHDAVLMRRGGEAVGVWRIAARGKVR
jgi:D-serine deaminase-like pyridoxal phosphate-dependent protein